VGRLLDALQRLGLAGNTVIVYASDNGRGPGRNAAQPLRGNKLTTYEAGLRVPCLVTGPGVRRGHVSSALVHAMDWYPTLATLAGVKVPEERVLDGRDLSPLLAGKTDSARSQGRPIPNAAVPRRGILRRVGGLFSQEYLNAFFYHGSEGQLAAVRSGRWKLALSPTLQLFDLEADPGESKPVRNPALQRKLRGMAVMFQEEMSRHARPAGYATTDP
jgi:arylsulfatase A-like enzyme